MDFEVEDDPYAYDWNSGSNKHSSKGGKKSSIQFGGGDDDDEYAYDYQSSSKNKGSGKAASSQMASTKQGTKANNVVVVDSTNALDRAKNMLSKYSSKPSEPAPKLQKSAKSFNEDDISIDSEEFSDMDISDSDDFKHKTTTDKVIIVWPFKIDLIVRRNLRVIRSQRKAKRISMIWVLRRLL